jgi:hypothetical protein
MEKKAGVPAYANTREARAAEAEAKDGLLTSL